MKCCHCCRQGDQIKRPLRNAPAPLSWKIGHTSSTDILSNSDDTSFVVLDSKTEPHLFFSQRADIPSRRQSQKVSDS